jgi:hypothetical protein
MVAVPARTCQQGAGVVAADIANVAGPAPAQKISEGAWAAAAASTKVSGSKWRRTELGRCLTASILAALPLSDQRSLVVVIAAPLANVDW